MKRILANAGDMVKEGAKAPGMPKVMTDYINKTYDYLWPAASPPVTRDGSRDGWAATAPPHPMRTPYRWRRSYWRA